MIGNHRLSKFEYITFNRLCETGVILDDHNFYPDIDIDNGKKWIEFFKALNRLVKKGYAKKTNIVMADDFAYGCWIVADKT